MNGVGGACAWVPGERPTTRRGFAESALEMLIAETCAEFGFQMWWRQDGDQRSLELLGPDSPGEYVFSFDRRECADVSVQELARRIYWWIVERGKEYHDGKRLVHVH